MSLPAERFAALHAASALKDHGNRARYISGCRCLPCRAANSRYESERYSARKSGDRRDVVSAADAQAHILKLSRQGIGFAAVGDASGVSGSAISKIRLGRRTQIRKNTEARILAVDANAIADGALVPAAGTHRLIGRLVADGYTRTWIAKQLGYKGRVLQFPDRVMARTALRIERLYARIDAGLVWR